jgi:hypothetical protein
MQTGRRVGSTPPREMEGMKDGELPLLRRTRVRDRRGVGGLGQARGRVRVLAMRGMCPGQLGSSEAG